MKTLRNMVIIGWTVFVLLEVILYFAAQNQELAVYRQDRMATIPILLFLTVYYIFRKRNEEAI